MLKPSAPAKEGTQFKRINGLVQVSASKNDHRSPLTSQKGGKEPWLTGKKCEKGPGFQETKDLWKNGKRGGGKSMRYRHDYLRKKSRNLVAGTEDKPSLSSFPGN